MYIRNQVFGFAMLCCIIQLLDFLSFHHLFGPWAIIIRDIIKDLVRFLVVLLIFMVGFTMELCTVYQQAYPNPDPDQTDWSPLASPMDIFECLFFGLFGLVAPDNLPTMERNPVWATTLVRIVYGTYLVITFIVLLNLLIAMMEHTYDRIQARTVLLAKCFNYMTREP
jgi:hypothetical protein